MAFAPTIPVIVLVLVFLGIAIRRIGRFTLKIWQIMLIGAVAVLVTGQISPVSAVRAVNLDVMIFLFGMFVVGVALHESGYLLHLSSRIYRRAGNPDQLILLLIFSLGILSAILMNDTLAIIGTPLALYFARMNRISPKLLLLALAFSITTGSVMSPSGTPRTSSSPSMVLSGTPSSPSHGSLPFPRRSTSSSSISSSGSHSGRSPGRGGFYSTTRR